MKTSCRLCSILAIAAVLAQSTAALAQPSTSPTDENIVELQRTIEALRSFGVQHWFFILVTVLVAILGFVALIAHQIHEMDAAEEDRIRAKWHKRLRSALALKLDTDNFSDAACWETAHDDLEAILIRRDEIQDAEATRLLRVKDNEHEYWEIAAYAATISDLSKAEVIEILRKAEAWEYRVLREAELQDERRQSHATVATQTTCPSLS